MVTEFMHQESTVSVGRSCPRHSIDNESKSWFSRLKASFAPGANSRLTWFLSYSIFCATLGMFQFGFNMTVVNVPERTIKSFVRQVGVERHNASAQNEEMFSDDKVDFIWATVVSSFAAGGIFGSALGGWLSERFGRKGGLILNTSFGVIGGVVMTFSHLAHSYEMIIIGRFLVGIHCGVCTVLTPMYISEVAPVDRRGGLGIFNQLAASVGMLTAQILSLQSVMGGNSWPYLFGFTVLPPVIQFIGMFFCCESPLFLLLRRKNREKARRALVGLRGSVHVDLELDEIIQENAALSLTKVSYYDLIRNVTLRRPLLIAVMLQLAHQWNGILAIFYYSTSIFLNTGMTENGAQGATVSVGVALVAMTLISVPLIESKGRRFLQLWGLFGMFVASICITVSLTADSTAANYVLVVATLCFVIFLSAGPGSIPWLITAELFAQSARAKAASVALVVNWAANFIGGLTFPSIQSGLGDLVFIPFSLLLLFFWLFTYGMLPETKGKTVEQIAQGFQTEVVKSGTSSSTTQITAVEDIPD